VPRRLLIIATASIAETDLRATVHEHAGEDAEMLIVAPASDISRLDWLTNAEDDARAEAKERADEIADAAPTDTTEARVGDSNPLKAIEDALRTFPADELIVVTRQGDDATWLEKKGDGETVLGRFSLPVTYLVVDS
jgi:hypothetical protein